MTGQRISRGQRILAGVSALALASAGMITMGGAAFANNGDESEVTPEVVTLEVGNIDFSKKGSIILAKHQHQSGTDATQNPNGTGTPIPSAPVKDVRFTAYPITTIDLNLETGWTALNALTPNADCTVPGHTLGAGILSPLTTDAGLATIPNLAVGAYLVCETTSPPEVVDKATPFIVTIPFPNANTWLYDVHVFPKNGVSTAPTKTINPQVGHGLNSVVEFPVTSVIPKLKSGTDFTSYIIGDTLDAKLGEVGVKSVTVDGVEIDLDADGYALDISGNTVTVSLVGEALIGLKAQSGKDVVVTFTGKVKAVGQIDNKATVYINDPDMENGTDSNTVTTNWGDVQVLKVDSSTPAKTLAGAEFEIWEADAPNASTCAAAKLTGATSPVQVGATAQTKFISGPNGVVSIPGLYVSDSVNQPVNASQRCYVLVETKAPAGYVTPTGDLALTPIAVKTGTTDIAIAYDEKVENEQKRAPNLPLTGAAGQLLMVAGGGAVLLVGAGLMVASRRRHKVEN